MLNATAESSWPPLISNLQTSFSATTVNSDAYNQVGLALKLAGQACVLRDIQLTQAEDLIQAKEIASKNMLASKHY